MLNKLTAIDLMMEKNEQTLNERLLNEQLR